jgi:biofilm protein TabA
MILDTLANAHLYHSLHPLFAEGIRYLHHIDPARERTELGHSMYALVTQEHGKQKEEAFLEAHRAYIDIHFCIGGHELIGVRPLVSCKAVTQQYDPAKDWMTFSDEVETWLTMTPGLFAIFFPGDAHATMVSDGIVHKCIVKVPVHEVS